MRTSWIDKSDNAVALELSGIMFWMVQAESYEQAVAVSLYWNSGKMEYPKGGNMKAID
jgi:hypothetical protein